MFKKEFPPILTSGFQEIALWQLDQVFLHPFGVNEHRKYLIDRLQYYIREFSSIGINCELWIDGSFTTEHPEPNDIDIVLLISKNDVDGLRDRKAELFEQLVINREDVRSRFSCVVYFIDKNDPQQIEEWTKTFGYDSRQINTKGIFKIIINTNV